MAKGKKTKTIPTPPTLPGPAFRSLIHLAESSESTARAVILDGERPQEMRDLALQTADGIRRAVDEIASFVKRYEEWWVAYLATGIKRGDQPREPITIDLRAMKAKREGLDVEERSPGIIKFPLAVVHEPVKFLDEDGKQLFEVPRGVYYSDGSHADVPWLKAEESDG